VGRAFGIVVSWGTPTRPTAPPARAMPHRRAHRLAVADALEDRVRAESAGELADALDRRIPSLADDIGRAESACERDPVGVTTEHDDLLGAEPPGGDDAAQAHRAVPDDSDSLARTHFGCQRRVVARPHHVRECQERRHQRVIGSYGQCDQRTIRKRDAHHFALATIELGAAPPAAVNAGRLQPLLAELATAVGPGKWCDHEVPAVRRLLSLTTQVGGSSRRRCRRSSIRRACSHIDRTETRHRVENRVQRARLLELSFRIVGTSMFMRGNARRAHHPSRSAGTRKIWLLAVWSGSEN
jgi:hypothetical protein